MSIIRRINCINTNIWYMSLCVDDRMHFCSLHVSDSCVSIIRRINCINTNIWYMSLRVDDRLHFYSLHVSYSCVSIIRRINCINTNMWCMSLCVDDRLVCRRSSTQSDIYTMFVLIQLLLLMMDTQLYETCRE